MELTAGEVQAPARTQPRRGEVWVANFNPARGRETGKVRPALVIQADSLGPETTPNVIVLPLSSLVDSPTRWQLTLPARDRLLKPSRILVDQPRTLARARLGEGPLTRLSEAELRHVDHALKLLLGLW